MRPTRFTGGLSSPTLGELDKVYMCLWLLADARRRGEPRDRQAYEYLASRHGDLWYELLAEISTGRLELAVLRAAANTTPRAVELAFYGVVLGIDPDAANPVAARAMLARVVDARLVMDAEYDLARQYWAAPTAAPTPTPTPTPTPQTKDEDEDAAGEMTGRQLRGAGLQARALAAWAGTDRLSALPARLHELAARPIVPASAVLALFVAGVDVPASLLRGIDLDDLVEHRDDRVRARVAILPLGESLLVCDRADAADDPDLVCWPDDSSYHLAASSLPRGRTTRWLDLGCGSAVAALARPEHAAELLGTDLNPRALRYAQLGAALSDLAQLSLRDGDLGAAVPAAWCGTCDLISCNAPIPAHADAVARWRSTTRDFFPRLFDAAAELVARDGIVVVHGALAELEPAADRLRGERVVIAYTPETEPAQFGVMWWRPHASSRRVASRRLLTIDRPHLDDRDRES